MPFGGIFTQTTGVWALQRSWRTAAQDFNMMVVKAVSDWGTRLFWWRRNAKITNAVSYNVHSFFTYCGPVSFRWWEIQGLHHQCQSCGKRSTIQSKTPTIYKSYKWIANWTYLAWCLCLAMLLMFVWSSTFGAIWENQIIAFKQPFRMCLLIWCSALAFDAPWETMKPILANSMKWVI